jgi:hypothetical protein
MNSDSFGILDGEIAMPENAENIQIDGYRINNKAEFDSHTFLLDGRTKGYVLYASDGRQFLVKYDEPLIKNGKLSSFTIMLIDPNIDKNDILPPSYISETFSHFFGRKFYPSETGLGIDDGGLIVAEISLRAEGSGLFFLIDDLNYKHITDAVLSKYYGSYQGQYDHIGRTMVGIAGRVLKEFYGIEFLGVQTDKTKGFYWEISGHPPKKPDIRMITKHLECIRDIKVRRELRQNLYIDIIKNIIARRFDPYLSVTGCDFDIEANWNLHYSKISSIFSDYKPFLSRFLSESMDIVNAKGVDVLFNQMIADYRIENIEWFSSISEKMLNVFKAQTVEDKRQRDRMIDELVSIEADPIVKNWLNNFKQYDITIDFFPWIKNMLSYLGGIFPIFDLNKIQEVEIGIGKRPGSPGELFAKFRNN